MRKPGPAARPCDRVAIGLHWLSAVLVLAAIAAIEIKGWLPKAGGLRDGIELWHFQIGALVLLATGCRIGWRFRSRQPPPGSRQARLAAATHALLYLMLLALPASGLAMLIAAGKPVILLGWELPVWGDGDRLLAKAVKRVHQTAGNLTIVLVAVHASAALWHQFVRRDGGLGRMLPRRD